LGHVTAIASPLFFKAVLESRRDDFSSTRLAVERLLALTEAHSFSPTAEMPEINDAQALLELCTHGA
jgi:hypothetical protein